MDENSLAGTAVDIADLASLVGQHLGSSSWHRITQDQVDRFAEATGDVQWIHVDRRQSEDGTVQRHDCPRLPDAFARPRPAR